MLTTLWYLFIKKTMNFNIAVESEKQYDDIYMHIVFLPK